jgi:hypothetical protein
MNKTLRMTKESLVAARPCYEQEKIDMLPIPPDGATPQQIASYNEIPVKDRIWALCYALNVGEAQRAQFDKILLTFACDVTEGAFQRAKIAPVEYKQLIDITRKFINGEASKDEVNSARNNTACNVAYNVPYGAAYRLAYNVARGAALGDADDTTYNVAYRAAYWTANNNKELLQKYLDMLAERLS